MIRADHVRIGDLAAGTLLVYDHGDVARAGGTTCAPAAVAGGGGARAVGLRAAAHAMRRMHSR